LGALEPLFVEFKARNNVRPTVVIDDVQKALDHGGPDAAADLELLGSLRQQEIIRLVLLSSEPVADRVRTLSEPSADCARVRSVRGR
jgi:hypothetical protein